MGTLKSDYKCFLMNYYSKRSDDFLKLSQFLYVVYAVGPVTQYRKVHRTFLPNFFALLKIWTLVFESLQPVIIKIAK